MSDARGQGCEQCDAVLSKWEQGRCACSGPRWGTINEVLYAIACSATKPLHARDFIRNAERDYGMHLNQATAVAALAIDPIFCWAGKGVYGLYRHGPLPGPRKLEEVTRMVLVAAGAPLTYEIVDFCMKRFGYRYSLASLRNAVAWSGHISSDWYGGWDHSRGEEAERLLRSHIPIVPPRQRAAWLSLRMEIGERISAAIAERDARLVALAEPTRFGITWETY